MLPAPHVLQVVLTTGVAGTERVVHAILDALAAHGTPGSIAAPEGCGLDELCRQSGVDVDHVVSLGAVTGHRSLWRNGVTVRRAVRRLDPDIVHIHAASYRWGLDVAPAMIAVRPAVVRTEHNPMMQAPDRLAGAALRLGDARVDRITYVSESNRARFEQLVPHRRSMASTVINNGYCGAAGGEPVGRAANRVALRHQLGIPAAARVALFVGHYGGRRPLRPLFEALARSIGDGSFQADDWHVLVAGDGPADEREAAHTAGVGHAVHFLGHRTDVPALLAAADAYVTASQHEGMSIAMLDAWASGLPVVTTPVDGISDVIGPDWRALAATDFTAGALAVRWRQLHAGDERWTKLQQQAIERVRIGMDAETMAAAYLHLYEELGAGRATRRRRLRRPPDAPLATQPPTA